MGVKGMRLGRERRHTRGSLKLSVRSLMMKQKELGRWGLVDSFLVVDRDLLDRLRLVVSSLFLR